MTLFIMKKYYKSVGGKIEERQCRIYREREESRLKWKEAKGTEHGRVKELRRSDNSHGSDIHLTPYTVHSDSSVRFGQWGKNPAQAEAVRSFTSFGRLSVKLR